jgi:hypothetical protein
MAFSGKNAGRIGAILAAIFLVAAIPVGIVWTLQFQQDGAAHPQAKADTPIQPTVTAPPADEWAAQVRRNLIFSWLGVGAAGLGAVLMVLVAWGRLVRQELTVAVIVPMAYAVLSAAPHAASMDFLPALRLLLTLGAAAAYLSVALALAGRLQYGVCCGVLGVAAVYFAQWEPPPPKPVPIAKSLRTLEARILEKLNHPRQERGETALWKGRSETLTPDVEKSLGADEYLELHLRPPEGPYEVLVFVTYNANAMSRVPHVPWVCMTQAGFSLVDIRQEDVSILAIPDKEIRPNVILFEGDDKSGKRKALMFQYFNVGGTYTTDRQIARFLATSGSIGHAGSYLSQTQVAIWLPPQSDENPLVKGSGAYRRGLELINILVPLLEREYYPDLHGGAGG